MSTRPFESALWVTAAELFAQLRGLTRGAAFPGDQPLGDALESAAIELASTVALMGEAAQSAEAIEHGRSAHEQSIAIESMLRLVARVSGDEMVAGALAQNIVLCRALRGSLARELAAQRRKPRAAPRPLDRPLTQREQEQRRAERFARKLRRLVDQARRVSRPASAMIEPP